MAGPIRIIPHAPKGIPDCGSIEVWFADGRPSEYFYWDDNRGRASITRKPDQEQAIAAAINLARIEWAKLRSNPSTRDQPPGLPKGFEP